MLTKVRDGMNELSELLEFTVAVIPEGLRAYSVPEGIINGVAVMMSKLNLSGAIPDGFKYQQRWHIT